MQRNNIYSRIIYLGIGLVMNIVAFAQPTSIYRIISSADELQTGDTVILAVESGGDVEQTVAIGSLGNDADISAFVNRHILTPPTQEKDLTFRVIRETNYYNFTYQDANYLRYLSASYNSYWHTCSLTGALSNASDGQWKLTYLSESKRCTMRSSYYLDFYNNQFYGSSYGFDQFVQRKNLNTVSGSPTTSTSGAYAISIFKKAPAYTLTYDFNGGQCPVQNEIGGSQSLPEATKDGAVFYCWRTKNGIRYSAGDRYPSSGALIANDTLIAEYRTLQSTYTQILNYSAIHDGDILIFLMEDGDGNDNPVRYGLYNVGSDIQLKNDVEFDFNTNHDKGYRFIVTKGATDKTLYLCNEQSKYYIYPTSGSTYSPYVSYSVTKSDAALALLHPMNDNGSHFAISNSHSDNYGYSYLCYYPQNSNHLFKSNYLNDQYALSVAYASPQGYSLKNATDLGYHPSSWSIYKETRMFIPRAVFNTKGQGSCELDTVYAYTLTLPDVTNMAPGIGFAGWNDGTTTYPPYTTIDLNGEDKWFTAVYEPISAHFVVNEVLGNAVPSQTNTRIVIPSCVAKNGYRFLGWALSNEDSAPDPNLHIGDTIIIQKTTYYYGKFEDLMLCSSYARVTDSKLENGGKYILTFEDGDYGPNKYVIHISEDNRFQLMPFDMEFPNPDDVFTYNGSVFSNRQGKHLGVSRSTTGWTDLSVNGGKFDNGYYSAGNGGIRLQYYNNYNGVGTECVVYTSTTSISLLSQSQSADQWSKRKSLAAMRKDGLYPNAITVYKQLPNYAYYVEYNTGVAGTVIPKEESCAVTLPTNELFEEPWKPILIGWATTPENAKAGLADAGEPGGYFVPTHDCTLYAVYRDVFYDLLEWKEDGVVIQTMNHAQTIITQVIPDNIPLFNSLDNQEIDAGVYDLKTTPLVPYYGHILDLTFRDSDNQYIFTDIWTVIPYIITQSGTTESINPDTAAWCDLVVLDGATLTLTNDISFRHVMIMPGGKLIIPADYTLHCKQFSLRGGHLADTTYQFIYPQLKVDGQLQIDNQTIWYDYLVSDRQQYNLALPYEVDRTEILNHLGDTVLRYFADYSGELRAQTKTGWNYTKDMVLLPGKGYTCLGIPAEVAPRGGKYVSQKYVALRFPMHVGESFSEQQEKSIHVSEYTSLFAPGFWNWNLVGNPYFSSFQGALYINDVEQNYVTIPNDSGTVYMNHLTQWTTLPAFNNFFVQAASTGELTFALGGRINIPQRELETTSDEWRTGIILRDDANGTTDQLGVLIGDAYTDEYEFNADLQKWMNKGLNVYAVSQEQLAFIAVNPSSAQTIHVGYQTPHAGQYTFALDSVYDLSSVASAILYDIEKQTYTDLTQAPYMFSSNPIRKETRFILSIMGKKEISTSSNTLNKDVEPTKMIINGQLMIHNGNRWINAQGQMIQ